METETGITQVVLPKKEESEGVAMELKKHELDEERCDQVEITKNGVMSRNHVTTEDASFLASLSDQVVSKEADKNGKTHEILNTLEGSKSDEPIDEARLDRNVEAVMDRDEIVDEFSGSLGHKIEAPKTTVEKSMDSEVSEEQGRASEGFLAKEDTKIEKERDEISLDTVKDEVQDTEKVRIQEDEDIVKIEVPENEIVNLPAVRLLVEQAEVVNGNTDVVPHEHKAKREVSEVAGAEKEVEKDEFSNPIFEEIRSVISEEEASKSRDGDDIHVEKHVEKELSIQREIASPEPESIQDNQKEDEIPNEEVAIGKTTKDEVIEELTSSEAHDIEKLAEQVNEESKESGVIKSSVEDKDVEVSTREFIREETNNSPESSKEYNPSETIHEKAIEELDTNIIIPCETGKDLESSVSSLSAKREDPKEVEICRDRVKNDDQTTISEEEILEKVTLSTQDKAEIVEEQSASQLKDRDQHEISEGEAPKKSEDEVQNNEQTGIMDKMLNFFSKTKDDEHTTVVKEEIDEEATLPVRDEEKSKEESATQLKDRDQHQVLAEEKKVEISEDEAQKPEDEVQKDEPLVKVEKEIVDAVSLSTTDSTQEEPSVSTQDKAQDQEGSCEEIPSPLKEHNYVEVLVEKKFSEDEVQKSDNEVPNDDKSHKDSAAEIIPEDRENESKDHDPNEVLAEEKKIEVYTDETPNSEREVQNNEQAHRLEEEETKGVALHTTISAQEETSKSTQAEAHDEEKSKEESTDKGSANNLKEDQDKIELLVEERKFEISNDEAVKSEKDGVNEDQAIKFEQETVEEVPLSSNSTAQEETSNDKQDKAQDEENLHKESTEDITEKENSTKVKGEDPTEILIEEKKVEISKDEAPKSEGDVHSSEQTSLMNKMFGYFSKTESKEPITRGEQEINEEVTVSTAESAQDKAAENIKEECVNELKDHNLTEVSVKDDKIEISKDETPESEVAVQNTENTGLVNKMFGYFSKKESEEVTVSTPESQEEVMEEREEEIRDEETTPKLKDREIEAEICKEEIVMLETTKASEISSRDMNVEGEIKEESKREMVNEDETETQKDQATEAETSIEEVAQVFETPKIIEGSVEASSEKREENPQEEAEVKDHVESQKGVYNDTGKIDLKTEEHKTESSENVDRDIQCLKESTGTGQPEKEITEVETNESVQCQNAEDALETLVSARSDKIIEEVPLSTTSTYQKETIDEKQDKSQEEEKSREGTTMHIVEEESADQSKGDDRTEVSAEENKVEISKDEALKSSDEVLSNEQPGLVNRMFGYFSKKENDEPITRVEEEEINEDVTVSTADSIQDKAAEIIEEESVNQSKDKVDISKYEAPNSEVEVHTTENTGLINKMFGYFSHKESKEVTVPTPESQQETPRDYSEEEKEIKTEITNEEATEKSKDRETEAGTSNEEVAQAFETPKAIECSAESSLEKQDESQKEDAKPQSRVEDPIQNVAEDTSSVESPKEVYGNPDKIESTTEEKKIESSEIVEKDIQNLQESSETAEKSEHVDHKPDLEKITEVETSKASESIHCLNTEDALETLVVAPSEIQHPTEGTLVKEHDETELANKDIALSYKGEAESGEHHESSVFVTSKDTETEPSSETTDTEKIDESVSNYTNKDVESSTDALNTAEILIEEKKIENTLSTETEVKDEEQTLKIDESGEKLEELTRVVTVETEAVDNLEEPVETEKKEEKTREMDEVNDPQDKATEIIEEEYAKELKDKVEISKDESPESDREVQNTEQTGLINKMLGFFSSKESEEVTVPAPESQQETLRDYSVEEKEIKEEIKTEIVHEEAIEKSKDRETEAETPSEEVAQAFETPKAIECSAESSLEKQGSQKEDAKPQSRVEDPIQNVAEDTYSVESPKEVYGNPNKIESTTEEKKIESSDLVDKDIQNLQESSVTAENSEHVDHKPDLEKITEVERSEVSESVQCKNTEDALETLVVAPSEIQHPTQGTLVNEDDETDLANKDIAISYKGEEEHSHQAAKEEAKSGENHESSVLLTSKDTETEPSSETTDTEKIDESVSNYTNKDVESSTDPLYSAEIPIEEKKIELTLSTETKEKEAEQTVKIDESVKKLEELPRVVTVETEAVDNLEEPVETEKKEEKTREIDEVNDPQHKATEITEEDCAKQSKEKVEISKDKSPESDHEVQNTEQTGLISKMFGFFSKKESEEDTVPTPELQQEIKEESEKEIVNEEAAEKPRDRETESETSNEEVAQALKSPNAIECSVEASLEKREESPEVISVPPSSSLQDEQVAESSKELEKEEEKQEGKTSLTEAKSDHDVVVEEIASVKEVEQESEENVEFSDTAHEHESLVETGIEEQREIESVKAVNEEKYLPSLVTTGLEGEEKIKSVDEEEVESNEEKSDFLLPTEMYLSESHQDNDQVEISDSFSGEAASETTLSKENKSTETRDTGSRSETIFPEATSGEDLGVKKPDLDATSEEEPIKSNDMIPEEKFGSDIAPVETDVQCVSEGTSSRVDKEESELPNEDVIVVARDRDFETRSNSASDGLGFKEDDKPIYNEEQTGQEREDEILHIARLSETPVDDSSEESGPSKEISMESSKQEGDHSKVALNVNEETQELSKEPEIIISRDTIPTQVHVDSLDEGIESAKIEKSIKSEESFEEILDEIKVTNPTDLTSDSPIQNYVAEKNEELVTIVTDPKEENESIVVEERSFGFLPETERKNYVEEVKLASDPEVTDAISPIPAVELRETSEAKEEANESSQKIPNDEIIDKKPREMEPELDEAVDGSHEVVTDRDLPVGVSAEPIQVSLEKESEKVAEEEIKEVKETNGKEESEKSEIAESETIEKSGSRSLPLEEQEESIATTIEEVKVSQETGSEVKDVSESSRVADEVVTDRDLPVEISREPIRDSHSTIFTEDSVSEILGDEETKDSLAEETKATEVHESNVEEGIESAKTEETIKSEEVFEEKNCSQIPAEVKELNSNELTSDSPVEEYVAKKNEESFTAVTEPKEENESVELEEKSFGFAPETEEKKIIDEVKLASDTKLDEEVEENHGAGKYEVAAEEKEEEETKKETETIDDEKTRDSLTKDLDEETKAKEEPEESDVAEVKIIENLGSRSLPVEEQEAGIPTPIKEVKVSEEPGSEVKDDAKSSHVVDEIVTDRDLLVEMLREPTRDLPSTHSDSEFLDDEKTKDTFVEETKPKLVVEEKDLGVKFEADSDAKFSEEVVLNANDAVKPVSERDHENEANSSNEKGLTISTKEIPETEVLSIAEKEDKDEAKKLEISEGPKVTREIETEKAHSPTEAVEKREERDFVSDKSGSPEPKTSIEAVEIIEDHLKIAKTDREEELSKENREVKARDTEAPTQLEETSQRDLKPKLVENPKEDTEHKKSELSTDHGIEEPKKKKKKEGENDDHNDHDEEEDEEEEEEEDEEDHDASTSVQSSKDGETKASKKKSHGLFSGVGSKVKHSISKVKKAITGKSSNNTKDVAAK